MSAKPSVTFADIVASLHTLTTEELITLRDTAQSIAAHRLLGNPAEGVSIPQVSEQQVASEFFAHRPDPAFPSTPLQKRMQSGNA